MARAELEACRLVDLGKILDVRGNLTAIEPARDLPFSIARVYWIYDVPGGEERGGHAYHTLQEFIIALSGSFDVLLDDGQQKRTVSLNRSYRGLFVPPMIWRHVENFSTNSVCLVLASAHFEEQEYIRDYSTYLATVRKAGSP
jgi:hypothetical protein